MKKTYFNLLGVAKKAQSDIISDSIGELPSAKESLSTALDTAVKDFLDMDLPGESRSCNRLAEAIEQVNGDTELGKKLRELGNAFQGAWNRLYHVQKHLDQTSVDESPPDPDAEEEEGNYWSHPTASEDEELGAVRRPPTGRTI